MMVTGMQTKTAALIGAVGLLAGWMAGSVATSRSQEPPASPAMQRRGPRPLGGGEPPAPYTEQLRFKLQEQPRSPAPSRNPFAFGSRTTTSAPYRSPRDTATPAPEAPEAPLAPAIPVAPRFVLSGMASTRTGDTLQWTAILNDNGAMVFAKAGDTLSGGVTVAKVEETFVVLVDAAGVEQTLRLK